MLLRTASRPSRGCLARSRLLPWSELGIGNLTGVREITPADLPSVMGPMGSPPTRAHSVRVVRTVDGHVNPEGIRLPSRSEHDSILAFWQLRPDPHIEFTRSTGAQHPHNHLNRISRVDLRPGDPGGPFVTFESHRLRGIRNSNILVRAILDANAHRFADAVRRFVGDGRHGTAAS